nr:mitofusin-1 like protein [Dugesia japonica]
MSSYENLLFDELDDLLRKLSYLCLESKRFVEQLFNEMGNAVSRREISFKTNLNQFIEDYKNRHSKFKVRVENLEVKLLRKNFQIFIYGQVSVGKSKIINAILREDIFKSGPDHTTSCFVKICKSPDESHHIEYRDIKKSFIELDDLKEEIRNLSTTNSEGETQLETNELLSVYLNIPDNKILTLNTEIIDCPGSANKESTTEFIKTRGLQADVFIYILTTNMKKDEKTFFQYQLENSSKPRIFFLVNKWDQAFNNGPVKAKNSKIRITKELIEFLTNQIMLSADEIENRIFFVSALDILNKRNNAYGNSAIPDARYKDSCLEFENFEKSFSQFINELVYHNSDLNKLKEDITKDSDQFKTDFQKAMYFENIEEFGRFLGKVQKSSEDQVKKIRSIRKDINGDSEIDSLLSKTKTGLNEKEIDKLLQNFVDSTEKKFLELQNQCEQLIFSTIDDYKKLTKIQLEKEKFKLTEMMEMEIKITNIWAKMRKNLIKLIRYIKEVFKNIFHSKEKYTMEEQINKANLCIKKFKEKIATNLNTLVEYLNAEFGKISIQLQLKIKVYKDFMKNTENLFK